MFMVIFGTVVEMNWISSKDRLEKKQNLRVWRWESGLMARIMSRLLSINTKYMKQNSAKRRGSHSKLIKFGKGKQVGYMASSTLYILNSCINK
jgi:hypothetical protein